MTKKEYHCTKNYIKSICVDSVREIASNVGLTRYETDMLISVNRGDSRVAIAIRLGACESKVSKDLRKIFTKVFDYLKRQI